MCYSPTSPEIYAPVADFAPEIACPSRCSRKFKADLKRCPGCGAVNHLAENFNGPSAEPPSNYD